MHNIILTSVLVFILLVIISLILYGIYSRFSRRRPNGAMVSAPYQNSSGKNVWNVSNTRAVNNLPIVAARTWNDINKAIKARDLTMLGASSPLPHAFSNNGGRINVGRVNGNRLIPYVLMLNSKPIAQLPLYTNGNGRN